MKFARISIAFAVGIVIAVFLSYLTSLTLQSFMQIGYKIKEAEMKVLTQQLQQLEIQNQLLQMRQHEPMRKPTPDIKRNRTTMDRGSISTLPSNCDSCSKGRNQPDLSTTD